MSRLIDNGRMFVVDRGDDIPGMWWRAWYCPEQLSKWRIRKAPEGTVPPWRTGDVAPEVLAGEDGQVHGEWSARWWVWAPDAIDPMGTASSWEAAMEMVRQAAWEQWRRENFVYTAGVDS